MESKDLPAEIHPLKSEEGKVPGKGEANAAVKVVPLRTPGRLSRWRTAAFFLSLFLCLIAVFAFSFIIPCPVRPISQKTWNRTYDNTVAYRFLTTRDVDGDMVEDIVFALQTADDDSTSIRVVNTTCANEGFTSPCAYLMALSGTDGNTIWQRPVAQEIVEADCSMKSEGSPVCLVVGKPDVLTVLNLRTGKSLWKQNVSFGDNVTVLTPLLMIPDLSKDSASDFMIFTSTGDTIKSWFFSGRHGAILGSKGSVAIPGWIGHLLQVTQIGAYYVLFCTDHRLYGYSVRELYHTAVGVPGHRDYNVLDPLWELAIDSISQTVPLLSSGEILYMKKMPTYLGTNILLVRSLMMELLNGQNLGSMWANNISNALSEPAFGSYRRETADIIIENSLTPHKKKVRIVSGISGNIEWETELFWIVGNPSPATLGTIDHRSMFFFWGTYEMNPAVPQEQHLYLFHPSYKNVFLDMNSIHEPIVAFKVVLLENSRHASYLLLTGQQAGEVPGRVTVYKHRLKEDIVTSRVIWINQLNKDTDDNVREHFLRLRYRSL